MSTEKKQTSSSQKRIRLAQKEQEDSYSVLLSNNNHDAHLAYLLTQDHSPLHHLEYEGR